MGWCWWCRPCRTPCSVISDAFSTDTSADWTEVDGALTIGSGVLTTTSATALFIHNTAGTTGHGRVSVRAKAGANSNAVRLIGSYVNADNYLFCELSFNSFGLASFKLFSRIAGSNTQIGSTYSAGTPGATNFHALELCWNGTEARGALNGTARVVGIYNGVGIKAGVGAVLASGTATFDDFEFDVHKTDNDECQKCESLCVLCENGGADTITLVIDGVVDDDCADCDVFNGTFVLDFIANITPFGDGTNRCFYAVDVSNGCAPEGAFTLAAYIIEDAGNYAIMMYFVHGASCIGLFRKEIANPFECAVIDHVQLELGICEVTESDACDVSAATVEATSN